MSQKSCESSQKMNAAAEEMKVGLRVIAGPDGSVKERISRAARHLGFSFSRTFDLWYGKARRIDAHEIDEVRARQAREEALRDETRELLAVLHRRMADIEARLVAGGEGVAAGPARPQGGEGAVVDRVLGRPSRPITG